MRALSKLSIVLCLAALCSFTLAAQAQAFDLSGLAQQFAKEGKRPGGPGGPAGPGGPHPGPVSGPIGGPVGGPTGQQPGHQGAPEATPEEQARIAELVVLLVGHALNDLSEGAEIYSSDRQDKNLNFLRYTVDKVVAALELDPQDGTLAPVARAISGKDPAQIAKAVATVDSELRANLSQELGGQSLWFYEAGQNISRVEFSIWKETQFNLVHFLNKSITLNVSFKAPQAATAGDMGAIMQALADVSGKQADLIGLVKQYIELRNYIEQRYGFAGGGMVLW